jgi:hypothetical protein
MTELRAERSIPCEARLRIRQACDHRHMCPVHASMPLLTLTALPMAMPWRHGVELVDRREVNGAWSFSFSTLMTMTSMPRSTTCDCMLQGTYAQSSMPLHAFTPPRAPPRHTHHRAHRSTPPRLHAPTRSTAAHTPRRAPLHGSTPPRAPPWHPRHGAHRSKPPCLHALHRGTRTMASTAPRLHTSMRGAAARAPPRALAAPPTPPASCAGH